MLDADCCHENIVAWWRRKMKTFSVLLALCVENSPVTDDFPAQRTGTRSFFVFFDLRMNKQLSKQSWGWRFGTPLLSLWRFCNSNPVWGLVLIIYRLEAKKISFSCCVDSNFISYEVLFESKWIEILQYMMTIAPNKFSCWAIITLTS